VSAAGLVRYYWLIYFSQPAADRKIYETLATKPIRSILEIGLGDRLRQQRLFDLCTDRLTGEDRLRYYAVDMFDTRPQGVPKLTLKQAHASIKHERVQVQLIPGDPLSAITRVANSVKDLDCIIIAGDQNQTLVDEAWRYLPRMISDRITLFREVPAAKGTEFKVLGHREITAHRPATGKKTHHRAA
jgi:hypothetical protein